MYKMILHFFYCFYVVYNNSDLQADSKNNNNYNFVVLYDLVSSSDVD